MREVAFQTLFALASEPDADRETIYRSLIKLNDDEQAPAFLNSLVSGVMDHQDQLDQQISDHLAAGWTIQRLAKPNLIILRLALYELQYEDDMPQAVAIDEALQLAKAFSDDRSRKFINGLLSNFAAQEKWFSFIMR